MCCKLSSLCYQNHLLVLLLLVFEATVYRHQIHHYKRVQRSPPSIPAIFPQSTRDKLDEGLLPCIRYLLNFSFYKFGLEVWLLHLLRYCFQITLYKSQGKYNVKYFKGIKCKCNINIHQCLNDRTVMTDMKLSGHGLL